ncbi:MAG: hypothetical protein DHS20C21_17950 [Gemmatimonadota bacterium]|nr:MAG: hypothetical protein DHS20C21_17950 [Gemmatimonadota bacterium]
MGEGPETSEEIEDARGLLCPLPVIHLGRRIAEAAPGAVIVLLADDPMTEEDVRLWAAGAGHEVLSAVENGGTVRIAVRRADDGK